MLFWSTQSDIGFGIWGIEFTFTKKTIKYFTSLTDAQLIFLLGMCCYFFKLYLKKLFNNFTNVALLFQNILKNALNFIFHQVIMFSKDIFTPKWQIKNIWKLLFYIWNSSPWVILNLGKQNPGLSCVTFHTSHNLPGVNK